MKKRMFLATLAIMIMFTLIPLQAQTLEDSPLETKEEISDKKSDFNDQVISIYQNDIPVTNISLTEEDRTDLYARTDTHEELDYQWQILVEKNLWVNISGENHADISVSYGMVANALNNRKAHLRVQVKNGTYELNSEALTINVEETQTTKKDSFDSKESSFKNVLRQLGLLNTIEAQDTADESLLEVNFIDVEDKQNDATNDAIDSLEETLDNKETIHESMELLEEPDVSTYTIIINYIFENEEVAAPAYTATVAKGSSFSTTVTSPRVLGYAPKDLEKIIELNYENINKHETIDVTYYPSNVEFTVKHLHQNIMNDEYTEVESIMKEGYTNSEVGSGLAIDTPGFIKLGYDEQVKIAADGSTVIEIKYDRLYFLMNFNLDGGYGVEPIYAKFGSVISIGKPSKVGYEFSHWKKGNQESIIPIKMPAEDEIIFTAVWEAQNVEYTFAYWYENADDDGYSYVGQSRPKSSANIGIRNSTLITKNEKQFESKPGQGMYFTYDATKTVNENNRKYIKADGTSVINIYFSRNVYTLQFDLKEGDFFTKPILSYEDKNYTGKNYTITAKYEADISEFWPLDSHISRKPQTRTGNGSRRYPYEYTDHYLRGWQINGSGTVNSSKRFTLTNDLLDSKANKSTTKMVADWTSNSAKVQLNYYVQSLIQASGGQRVPKNGIWYDLSDYTQEATDFGVKWGAKDISGLINVSSDYNNRTKIQNFYYNREIITLEFQNVNKILKSENLMFEEPLLNYEPQTEPDYPQSYEKDAYKFDDWYTTSNAIAGTKFDFETEFMPNSNVKLYANWVKVERTVNFYQKKGGSKHYRPITVLHGESISEDPGNPENGNYKFVGWFYKDIDGKERAFDLSMPVNQDMDLYAKWTSNKVMDYTIKYQFKGEKIADDKGSEALAGATKTFDAKYGNQLYDGFRSGYFPKEASHSITIDIDDEEKNVFIFEYVERENVPYTVRYLEKGTNDVLSDEKIVENNKESVVTEPYMRISKYRPDAYTKRLILSSDKEKNIITFYYEKDEVHAPIKTTHYQQNEEGDGYREFRSEENLLGVIGELYSANIIDHKGFDFNTIKSDKGPIFLTEDGYEFELYYNRISYPYEFQFLEENTNKLLHDSVGEKARYGVQVSQNALDINGYTLTGAKSQSIIIDVVDPEVQANKNIKTFYYAENKATINYRVIGSANSGVVDLASETIKVLSGAVNGSTATPLANHKFMGWFKDSRGLVPVSPSWVDGNKINPQKLDKELWTDITYYAKFEEELADLEIVKTTKSPVSENQSFIFNVKGKETSNQHINLKVVINMTDKQDKQTLIIKDLPLGKYDITEEQAWSWRYKPNKDYINHELKDGGNFVEFINTKTRFKWLSGDSFKSNIFTP